MVVIGARASAVMPDHLWVKVGSASTFLRLDGRKDEVDGRRTL